MRTYQGELSGEGRRFAIVVSRFNEFISKRLLEGAVDMLTRHKVEEEKIGIFWVPGALELLYVANRLASKAEEWDVVICLGALLKGETSHFEFLSAQVIKGIAQISLNSSLPVISGVITADSLEQAIQRAGAKEGNKGASAALVALEMANLSKQIM
ncbi:MAG: 6,7-dimethyl-8-ribityllumazine synthase [Candidatus Omnitrophota bacterium]|nr:MAG: 6,7-dimethyl-8-ribityllumazine synthase [Candidatus Omnitrophota bacterium]